MDRSNWDRKSQITGTRFEPVKSALDTYECTEGKKSTCDKTKLFLYFRVFCSKLVITLLIRLFDVVTPPVSILRANMRKINLFGYIKKFKTSLIFWLGL